MIRITIRNVNPAKLQDELIYAGIKVLKTESKISGKNGDIAEQTSIAFDDDSVDMELVQQIIDEHDPTPLPEPLNEIDRLKISQAEQFETILELLGGM